MFVFYDIETTGLDVAFDQILQFGAILTDENLNEIDRAEFRCRILPWITPSPSAMAVTATDVDGLSNQFLPNFFEMMTQISDKFTGWGPATFIGYNSMPFDEPFLQRALWQALLPPYVTVTNGNTRLDLLPIIKACAAFAPECIDLPHYENGKPSFKLDSIAPTNGFMGHKAHDALGDVEATIFLAKLIKRRAPSIWESLTSRTSKSEVLGMLQEGNPLFLFRHRATRQSTICQFIGIDSNRRSHAVLAQLDFDWERVSQSMEGNLASIKNALFRVAMNKAPVLFTQQEMHSLAGLSISPGEISQAKFLGANNQFCRKLLEAFSTPTDEPSNEKLELEETIYSGFASSLASRQMQDFHAAAGDQKVKIARSFDDKRFRSLAMRMLYVENPNCMTAEEKGLIEQGIARRLRGLPNGQHKWRAVADALNELEQANADTSSTSTTMLREWLIGRMAEGK